MTYDRYMSIVRTISRHFRACHILSQGSDSFFVDRLAAQSYVLGFELEMELPTIEFEPCQ